MSFLVIVDFVNHVDSMFTDYVAPIAVMVATDMILCAAVVAETWIYERISMFFWRITAITFAIRRCNMSSMERPSSGLCCSEG